VRNDWLARKVVELQDMVRSSSHALRHSDEVDHA